MSSSTAPSAWLVRTVLAVFGGYALSAALVTGLAGLLAALGMAPGEAVVLTAMLGFLLYLVILLMAFTVAGTGRLWLALGLLPLLAWGVILVSGP